MSESTPDSVVRELRLAADALTTPLPVECLMCFVWRMLDVLGCNATLRWTRHWRDRRAPRATSLERRLAQRGAFCDCEIFLNGWVLAGSLEPRTGGSPEIDSRDADPRTGWPDADWPGTGPPQTGSFQTGPLCVGQCAGVRRGSTQPCAVWVRRPQPGAW